MRNSDSIVKRTGARSAALVLMLTAVAVGSAQTGTLWVMDGSAGAANLAGWDAITNPTTATSTYALTRLATGNFNGGPAYEFHINNTSDQLYLGWLKRMEANPPQNGQTRYFRFRTYYDPASRFSGSALNNKMLMFADGNSSRLILHMNNASGFESQLGLPAGAASTGLYGRMYFAYNIGTSTPDQLIELGRWYHVQGSFTLSTTGGSNGTLRLWVNNNNQASPSKQVGGLPIYTSSHNNVSYGRFWSNALAPGAQMKWRMADFEYGTTFDSSWYPGGGGSTASPPAAPTAVRILR